MPTAFLGDCQAQAIRNGVWLRFSQPISVTETSLRIIPISPKQAKRFSNLTSDDRPKKPSHLRPTSRATRRRAEDRTKRHGDTGPPTGGTQAGGRSAPPQGGWGCGGRGVQRPTLQEGSVPLEEGAAWPEGWTWCAETEEKAAWARAVHTCSGDGLQTRPSKWLQNTVPAMPYPYPPKMHLWRALGLLMEKAMATYSSTLAWKIPWAKDPGRLQSIGWQRVRHN